MTREILQHRFVLTTFLVEIHIKQLSFCMYEPQDHDNIYETSQSKLSFDILEWIIRSMFYYNIRKHISIFILFMHFFPVIYFVMYIFLGQNYSWYIYSFLFKISLRNQFSSHSIRIVENVIANRNCRTTIQKKTQPNYPS